MTSVEDAARLVGLVQRVQWDYPSSSGRPTREPAPAWLAELTGERRGLIAAVGTLLGEGKGEQAAGLAARGWRVFVAARDNAGGRALLGAVIEQGATGPATRDLALCLYGDSLLAFRLGDLAASGSRAEAALRVARAAGDREAEGLALLGLSRADFSASRFDEARAHAAEARALLSGFGLAFTQAPLHMMAQATRAVGTVDEAAPLFEESLALNRALGDEGMVTVELHNLGHVELRRGRVEVAERLFAECQRRGTPDDPYGVALGLFNEASVAAARHDTARARRLLAEMRAALARDQMSLADDDAAEVERLELQLRAASATEAIE